MQETPIISSLDAILELIKTNPEKWDEIKFLSETIKLNRFPTVPKDEKECYYDELKGRRDSIKKYLVQICKYLICTEKEFYEELCGDTGICYENVISKEECAKHEGTWKKDEDKWFCHLKWGDDGQ